MPGETEFDEPGDDMRFESPDTNITNNYPQPSAAKWVALAAGLIGGGLAFQAPAIIEALKPEPSTTVVQPGEDTNTQYELQFFED